MRLVYLDEAGISNPTHEPFVVVAGVIVHGDAQLIALKKRLEKVVKRHIPIENQDGFILHAKEIFNGVKGTGLFGRENPDWSLERRLAIADELASIPKELSLRLVAGWVERSKLFQSEQEKLQNLTTHQKTIGAIAVAFLNCVVMTDLWMRKHSKNQNCIVVMEDNETSRKTICRVQNFNQDGKSNDLTNDLDWREFFPLQRIVEDPLFQPKKASHPLELADFFAYIWKRYLMNQTDARYLRFLDPMRPQIATVL